jgi:hypothetical protein
MADREVNARQSMLESQSVEERCRCNCKKRSNYNNENGMTFVVSYRYTVFIYGKLIRRQDAISIPILLFNRLILTKYEYSISVISSEASLKELSNGNLF